MAGVGFGSSFSPTRLVHRPFRLAEELLLHPPDAAMQRFPAPLRRLLGISRSSRMDQHQFVQRLDNLREKHLPLGGDAVARGASGTFSKGHSGCAALQQHFCSPSISPPWPTSPSPSLSTTFLCNPCIDFSVL